MIMTSVLVSLLLLLPTLPGQAAQASATNSRDAAWSILRAGMTDSNSINRSEAIEAIGTIGPTSAAVGAVEQGFEDKDPLVRQTTATVLGGMKSRRAIPSLETALHDQSPQVRLAAAHSLWELGDRSASRQILIEVLSRRVKTSDNFVAQEIGTAKRDIHNPNALAKIGITQGAEALLGPFGMGVGFAEDVFKDQGAVGQSLAASLLAADSSPASLTALEEALLDENAGVRAAAAEALGRRANRSAIPDLGPLLHDRSAGPRFMAAAAIIRLTEHYRK
ncbi:MAG TPA: HEAT repeat domain-containing protein [Terriglobia bacterium]|nr:HEAT repeat domain-containing protein [Terriglobia bacterium]